MSALDLKLTRLLAAATELRAAAVDHADYLGTTTPGPLHEGNSLATVEALARISEIVDRATINFEANYVIAVHNACCEHGRATVMAAAEAGVSVGKGDCPCADCRSARPDRSLS